MYANFIISDYMAAAARNLVQLTYVSLKLFKSDSRGGGDKFVFFMGKVFKLIFGERESFGEFKR